MLLNMGLAIHMGNACYVDEAEMFVCPGDLIVPRIKGEDGLTLLATV